VLESSQGTSFKTNSAFINDTWRISDRWTVNLGLRYDKNDGTDASGTKTIDDARVSPRLSAAWDVKGDGKFIVTAGANRYVTAVANTIADGGSLAGQPTWAGYFYGGPAMQAGTTEYPTNFDVMTAVFDWFFNEYGGPSNGELRAWADIPGISPVVSETLRSPYGDEFTLGFSWRLGSRGVLRADLVRREFGDFYTSEIVPNRFVIDDIAGPIDVANYINNDSLLKREYNALMTRFDYRVGSRWSFGASYTYSKAEGNFNGETAGSGPVPSGILEYQEYREKEWNAPDGWLGVDQRHKFRGYAVWDMISSSHHNLSTSVLFNYWSGTAYSAVGSVYTVPYVGDPADLGYVGAPGNLDYYFSDRGEYRWDDITRTDLAINYSFFVNIGGGQLELFLQPEVLNLFNQSGQDGGNTAINDNTNSDLAAFDPFTETPVEGVHWEKGPSFGEPTSSGDYQAPRTFRFSVGLRF
jgi:hypothetical protein